MIVLGNLFFIRFLINPAFLGSVIFFAYCPWVITDSIYHAFVSVDKNTVLQKQLKNTLFLGEKLQVFAYHRNRYSFVMTKEQLSDSYLRGILSKCAVIQKESIQKRAITLVKKFSNKKELYWSFDSLLKEENRVT